MDDDAQEAAWHRIETALARLDTAARSRSDGAADGAALAERLYDEQSRHSALRHALRETLGRMDELIATHTGPHIGKTEDGAA